MTCIVGIVDGARVVIGADSAGVGGWDMQIRADEKVFRNGPFVIGGTTSFRMLQLLRHALKPPEPDPCDDIDRFMVTTFVDAVRGCLKDGGFATKESEAERGGQFLVGYRNCLFEVGGDYQVGRNASDVAALGCGAQVALGALWVTPGKAEARVRKALDAAERFSAGVRGPFVVLATEARKGKRGTL